MTTGIVVTPDPAAANAVDDAIAQASGAFHRGVRQVWLNQRFDVDALTPGGGDRHRGARPRRRAPPSFRSTPAIRCWSPPRHRPPRPPRTANFSLGIGLGGNELEQRAFGIPAARK